jgi:DNA-binding NarL/FixJ family response regulator
MSDRVLVVADDIFELSTISAALKLHGTNVVGEARKAAAAISLQRSLQPNALLIDMHVNGEDSITVATAIRKENPLIGIILLVACADFRLLGQSQTEIPAGTKVIIKSTISNIASLCEIISESRIFASDTPITWIHGNVVLDQISKEHLMSKLTNIQIDTLRMVADGLTNAEIGRMRFVSEKAIEQIISRISQVINVQPDRSKNMRVQLVGEYFKWIGAPRH